MRCDEGYECQVCHQQVEEISESDLYLRYVIGELKLELLNVAPEMHIRCNPVQAQFIVHKDFEPVQVEGPFNKSLLDPADRQSREDLITRGWLRLQSLPGSGIPVTEYPLEDVR